ncbi:MAG: cysteine--tRNA ligase [Rhodothermales bacterium]|nr:cysteine--tRNA ligase [Rhodothermales bacterium]
MRITPFIPSNRSPGNAFFRGHCTPSTPSPPYVPSLRLYNTLTGRTEPVDPVEPGKLRFYSCGPTVYSYAHIGNFRSFLTADLLFRTARASGLDVTYATNITDVGHLTEDDLTDPSGEDRMVKALQSKEGERFINVWDLARYYADELLADWRRLNMLEPTVRPRATEHMREQILAVQKLIESGHAYETEKGVYFDVETFGEYGKLSGNTDSDTLEQGVRDTVQDEDKRHPRDFALWKKDEAHLMQWFSPWGWGFPGWHIECSVMAMSYLGDEIDIHAGGEDLIFPHHECEIAQSESLTGKPFARHWVHTRFLQVEGEKMSKSRGNFLTVRDLVLPESEGGRGVDPLALRMTLIAGHYRKPFNFTFDTLRASVRHVERIRAAAEIVDAAADGGTDAVAVADSSHGTDRKADRFRDLTSRIREEMTDDLNTPAAIAALLEGVKLIHSFDGDMTSAEARAARDMLDHADDLLGIVRPADEAIQAASAVAPANDDAEIDRLIEERRQARADRDFQRADEIRDELTERGIEIMDTPDGTDWKRKSTL